MKYFTKLSSDCKRNDNSINMMLKVHSYTELNLTISSLLKASINIMKDDFEKNEMEIILLLEIALQLLPIDEMELLDQIFGTISEIRKTSNEE
jgi:hypothetical protein